MKKPSILRQIITSVPDHEILLSFNDDDDAEVFGEWWSTKGENLFMKYAKKLEEEEGKRT